MIRETNVQNVVLCFLGIRSRSNLYFISTLLRFFFFFFLDVSFARGQGGEIKTFDQQKSTEVLDSAQIMFLSSRLARQFSTIAEAQKTLTWHLSRNRQSPAPLVALINSCSDKSEFPVIMQALKEYHDRRINLTPHFMVLFSQTLPPHSPQKSPFAFF